MFLIAKRAEKDDFSQKNDEDGLTQSRATLNVYIH